MIFLVFLDEKNGGIPLDSCLQQTSSLKHGFPNHGLYLVASNFAVLNSCQNARPSTCTLVLDICNNWSQSLELLTQFDPSGLVMLDFAGTLESRIEGLRGTLEFHAIQTHQIALNKLSSDKVRRKITKGTPALITIPLEKQKSCAQETAQKAKSTLKKFVSNVLEREDVVVSEPGTKTTSKAVTFQDARVASKRNEGTEQEPLLGQGQDIGPEEWNFSELLAQTLQFLETNCCCCFDRAPTFTPVFRTVDDLELYLESQAYSYNFRKIQELLRDREINWAHFQSKLDDDMNREVQWIEEKYQEKLVEGQDQLNAVKNRVVPTSSSGVFEKTQKALMGNKSKKIANALKDCHREVETCRQNWTGRKGNAEKMHEYSEVVKQEITVLRKSKYKFSEERDRLMRENGFI